MGRHVYRGFLEGVPIAELRLILQQGGAAGDDPVAACESAVRSIRAAFAQPGALERTVHHTIGDMPGRQLLVQLVADCVVHLWAADSHQRTGRLDCPGCGSLAPADSARPFSQLAESTNP